VDAVTTWTCRPSALTDSWVRPETRTALDAFFRGFGFTSEADLSALAAWALEGTSLDGSELDASLALACGRVEAWLTRVLGRELASGGGLLKRGRAAFVLCDGASRGARVLTQAVVPEDFARALRAAVPVPVPPSLPSVMPEQTLAPWALGELLRRWWRAVQPDVSISR
jgi:hypothetical protein